jgi:hypothetical protein
MKEAQSVSLWAWWDSLRQVRSRVRRLCGARCVRIWSRISGGRLRKPMGSRSEKLSLVWNESVSADEPGVS